jgi:hypothetical protein
VQDAGMTNTGPGRLLLNGQVNPSACCKILDYPEIGDFVMPTNPVPELLARVSLLLADLQTLPHDVLCAAVTEAEIDRLEMCLAAAVEHADVLKGGG